MNASREEFMETYLFITRYKNDLIFHKQKLAHGNMMERVTRIMTLNIKLKGENYLIKKLILNS